MTSEQDIEFLKSQNNMLQLKVGELDRENHEIAGKLARTTEELDSANEKIKFLEGQIDAYQYCLNSRFAR